MTSPAPDPAPALPPSDFIGIFDSGVGGLSVLRALRRQLPDAPLHYLADSAWAPYGDRSVDEIVQRSLRITEHLLAEGARIVVVACNTATTQAIAALRARWPQVPFVGVEPGVKPAAALSTLKRIGVMATRSTVHSERMRHLVATHAQGCEVLLQPCPGLVDAIERGADDATLDTLVARHTTPLREAGVDVVVLGCTHYPFVAERIQACLGPQVQLVDTGEAVARRVQAVWQGMPPRAADPAAPRLRLQTTGDPAVLSAIASRLLDRPLQADAVKL
jgi:glutamate racemase